VISGSLESKKTPQQRKNPRPVRIIVTARQKSNKLIFVPNYHFKAHPSSTNNTPQNVGRKTGLIWGRDIIACNLPSKRWSLLCDKEWTCASQVCTFFQVNMFMFSQQRASTTHHQLFDKPSS
jgi:hypothetical protein